MAVRKKLGRRRLPHLPARFRRRRLDAKRCAGCRRQLYHPSARDWRAFGPRTAIRCLDCRLAFCPRCAKKHFAPVAAVHAKVMNAVVNVAIKAMRSKCREVA